MKIELSEFRIRGKNHYLPSVRIRNCIILSIGKWLKTAQFFDEELIEQKDYEDPINLIPQLRASPLAADIFTFSGPTESPLLECDYPFKWDNVAIVPTDSFEDWWKGLPQQSRKNVRLAEKRGIAIKSVDFDEPLIRGIKKIYDETPIRQGRQFWHYQKDIEMVRIMNETYLDRSQFVGAFHENELVGFIKYIIVDKTAVLIQIIAMEAHRDKRIVNALLSHTVKLCNQQGLLRLTYGKFDYGINQNSTLSEFKRRNGFSELRFKHYYVPLTTKGKLAVKYELHLGITNFLPIKVTTFLHKMRAHVLRVLRNKN
jgi:hypothetical protein